MGLISRVPSRTYRPNMTDLTESGILLARLQHILNTINETDQQNASSQSSEIAVEKMLRKQLIQVLTDSNITVLNRFFFEFVNEKQFFEVSVFEVILVLYRSLTNKIKKVNIQDIDETFLKPVIEFLRQNVRDENRRGRKRKENSQSETEINSKISHEQLAISEQHISTSQGVNNFDIGSNIVQMKKRGGKIGHTKTLQETEETVDKNNDPAAIE